MRALPPDDDPRFTEWLGDVGPMQSHPDDLPDIEVGRPLVAALLVLIGLAGVAAGAGWIAFAYAVQLDVFDTDALVLLIVGTALIFIGAGLAYLAHRRRNP